MSQTHRSKAPAHRIFHPRRCSTCVPRWQRILVALAGPVMNILTALAIPFAGAMMYGVPATPSPVVYYIQPGGAAEKAGLKQGDRIVSFNGTENPSWDVNQWRCVAFARSAFAGNRKSKRIRKFLSPLRPERKPKTARQQAFWISFLITVGYP